MMLRKRTLLVLFTLLGLLVLPGSPAFAMQEAEQHGEAQAADDHTVAEEDEGEHGEEGEELDPVHHSADAPYLDFEPFGKLQLPRIFLVSRDDGSTGVDFFGSTDAAIDAGYMAHMDEGVHSVLDAHLEPATGHVLVDFSITKHLIFAWIGSLLVALIFIRLANMYKRGVGRETAPKGIFQNLFESLVMYIRDEIAVPVLGPKADKYLPYLLTAFFFILTCNLLGLVPFGATATANIMVTAVLASFTFVLTQIGGTKDYWKHIFWPPDAPVFVKIILMPVEILGLFTKPFALAVRLFANMTAGHLVILSLIGLIFAFTNLFGPIAGYGVVPVSIAFALFINLLELLVATIQAYVFTMLSALFINMAVEEHHHGHDPTQGITDHGHLVETAVAAEPAVT